MAAIAFILTVVMSIAAIMFFGGLFALVIAGAWLTLERPGPVATGRLRVALGCGAIAAAGGGASLACFLWAATVL